MIFDRINKRNIFRVLILLLGFSSLSFGQATIAENGALRLLEVANTPSDDHSPCFTPDGNGLYFSRKTKDQNKANHEVLFSYSIQKGKWSSPRRVNELSNGHENMVGFVSKDGKRHYVQGVFQDPDSQKELRGIFLFVKQGKSWKLKERLKIPYFKNKSKDQSFCLSPDERVMIVSMEGYPSKGVEDLYFSKLKEDGTWTEMSSLGDKVNTPFEDFYPWLDKDGRSLYFSSNGFPGQGSKDIFFTYRLDDTWKNWTPPINLGKKFNTEGMDLSFRRSPIHEDQFIMVSATTSEGHSDLYQYLVPDSILPNPVKIFGLDTLGEREVEQMKLPKKVLHDNSLRVLGLNKKTGRPLSYTAFLMDPRENLIDSLFGKPNDTLLFQIDWDTVYLKVNAPGHLGKEKRVIFQNTSIGLSLLVKMELDSIEIGKTIQMEDVLFVKGTPRLIPSSYLQLDRVFEFLAKNPERRILLMGHTDTAGDKGLNQKLSEDRAKAVKSYLVKKGIKASRINTRGFGGSKPLSDKRDEISKLKNRRVEFLVL